MENSPIDHTQTLLLKHMTNHHVIGRIGCTLEKQTNTLFVELDNINDLANLNRALKKIQAQTQSLQHATTSLSESTSKTAKLIVTHIDEIVILLHALHRKPYLVKSFSNDIKIPFFPLKRKSAKWLLELIKHNQTELEVICQKNQNPILFKALSEYGKPLADQTYQLFLKQSLRETSDLVMNKLDENQALFLKKLEFHPKKSNLISFADSKKGANYIKNNLKHNIHSHLTGTIEGYYHLYTHPFMRWIPTAFNRLINHHLSVERKLISLYNQLKVVDAESHTKFDDAEIAHHYKILVQHARHLHHQIQTINLD